MAVDNFIEDVNPAGQLGEALFGFTEEFQLAALAGMMLLGVGYLLDFTWWNVPQAADIDWVKRDRQDRAKQAYWERRGVSERTIWNSDDYEGEVESEEDGDDRKERDGSGI